MNEVNVRKKRQKKEFKKAALKLDEYFPLLEKIETGSELSSFEVVMDKMETLKKSQQNMQNVLIGAREYTHIEFKECTTFEKNNSKLSGELLMEPRKVKISQVKVNNKKSGKNQQEVSVKMKNRKRKRETSLSNVETSQCEEKGDDPDPENDSNDVFERQNKKQEKVKCMEGKD